MDGSVSRVFDSLTSQGKLAKCIDMLEEGLRSLRKTPYHTVLGRDFLHHTQPAAEYLITFYHKAAAKTKVAAIYCEMNGFTINPDRWYFDGFAYDTAGNTWELEWLAHWNADTNFDQFTLTGMERVQEAFARYYCDAKQSLSMKMAAEVVEHLVNARFMQLIAAAHKVAKRKCKSFRVLPLLATAHDWDIVNQTT